MDVMNVEQAKIAEEAGACAVMALGMSLVLFGPTVAMGVADTAQSVSPPTSDATVVSPVW
jgi:pyridoxal biosynthesis lyase PdxS